MNVSRWIHAYLAKLSCQNAEFYPLIRDQVTQQGCFLTSLPQPAAINNRERMSILGSLVSTFTEDKVRLDGFYCESPEKSATSIDAAILVHGLSGNFYKSRLLKHFANELSAIGIDTLLVNTRGHDFLNATPRMGRTATLGAAVEVLDEAKYDLQGWVQFLQKQGRTNVILVGHSLGAIKSLYAQAHLPQDNVKCIAAFSATKLSYDSLLGSSRGERFSHWLVTAKKLVAENSGDQLMYVDFPFPTWMSANAYLKKYGDGDRYNWLNFMDRIEVPVLAAFGEIEMKENPAFVAMQFDLASIDQPNFSVQYVANADHFYSACFQEAGQCLIQWLGTQN